MSQFGSRARAFFDKAFPERQIYHRSGGSVRYVSLSPSKQAMLAIGAVGVAGWCVYATANTVLQGPQSTATTAELERLQQKYDRWLGEARAQSAAAQAQLDERTRQFEIATRDFEERHEVLRSLIEYAGNSNVAPSGRPIERDGARILAQASIDEAEPRQSRGVAAAEPYQVQTVGFQARQDTIRHEQELALAELEDTVAARSEQVRGVLRLTGVSMAALTDGGGDEVGAPMVPQNLVSYLRDSELNPEFTERVTQVAARIEESRRLEAVAGATPLSPPVAVDYRETSGFGTRIDPFTGRLATHYGLDMAAFDRAPVVSTSPGVVAFAGRKSGYGNVVEIDHGHGFKTRYGHLRDIQVSRGERVSIGQRIGSMGSTGRSTATHLHYEVWFRGRPVDPVNFLRAGRHVHEQG